MPPGTWSKYPARSVDLGVDVAGEAGVGHARELALQDGAGVGAGGLAVGGEHVAEHAGHPVARLLLPPGQHLEGRGVRAQEHVGLEDAGQALHGAAVKADSLLEGALDLRGGYGHGLQLPDDVGEPQAHEADVALLDGAEHVLLLLVHGASCTVREVPSAGRGPTAPHGLVDKA